MQQLIIDSKILNKGLKSLAPAFAGRSVMPLLDNVLVTVLENEVVLTATDMKLTVINHLPLESTTTLKWLLPYKELTNITAVLAGPVTIEVDKDRKAFLKSGAKVWKLGVTEDPSLYVKLPEFETDDSIEVDGAFFWSLQQAAKSVSTNEGDLVFQCVCLDPREGEMRIVSSNRSVMYLHKFPTNKKFKKQALFYPDFVRAVKEFNEAKVSFNGRFIRAESNHLTVIATCADQRFANYEMMLPNDRKVNCEIETSDVQNAIDEILVYGSQVPASKLSFNSSGIKVDFLDEYSGREVNTFIHAEHSVAEQTITANAKLIKEMISQFPPNTEKLQCIVPDNAMVMWMKPVKEDYDITLTLGLIGQ